MRMLDFILRPISPTICYPKRKIIKIMITTLMIIIVLIISKYSMPFFNIKNYLPEVIKYYITAGNNFDIKQEWHGIIVLLYATKAKQDLGR